MSTYDILDDRFPHGTVQGYDGGCRTNHCPAPIPCHVFRTRYVGEWDFRKRVDAGWSAAEIVAAEVAEVEAARAAAKAARRVAPVARVKPNRKRAARRREDLWSDDEIARLRELNGKGLLDVDIAAVLKRTPRSIGQKRYSLGIQGNHRDSKPITHGTYAGYAAGCREGCPSPRSCKSEAQQYWRDRDHARRRGISVTEYRKQKEAA